MALLQASWVHVYLSYPFVMGWSLLVAAIVGSKGMPVEEAIEHNVEGRLIPMDQPSCWPMRCCNYWLIPKAAFVVTGGATKGFALRPAAYSQCDDLAY